ncbi:MAG: glutathione-regulated potassium-efflux system oxidoreductase KefF [Betaproteobacteria bacterium]|nr:glutathione-regulated potassium-efflux system oxidoreductase KefF [Betaproteobacteria bacterium]
MILVIYAHPYPKHSRAGRALLAAVDGLPGVEVRSLYDLYPDFDIDTASEQAALLRAETIVWLHPIYWYSPPSLLKHWFENVLARGWAYSEGGDALKGKRCLWVPTTGGDEAAYTPNGIHEQPFENFIAPIEQTARFCGMQWLPPIIVHGAHVVSDEQLQAKAEEFRARLIAIGRSATQ